MNEENAEEFTTDEDDEINRLVDEKGWTEAEAVEQVLKERK